MEEKKQELKNPSSPTIDDVQENLEHYNPTKKRRVLIVLDDMIERLSPIVTEFNISLVFISRSYFKKPKTIRLNTTHYFIIKILNKRELQQIT